MSPWEVIEGCLARKRPPRDQRWLANELGIKAQAITNWKTRGVPAGQYAALADLFGLTMDQVAGKAPLPWESGYWPFPDIESARFSRLTPAQRNEIQDAVLAMIERFEAAPHNSTGKSSSSRPGTSSRAA